MNHARWGYDLHRLGAVLTPEVFFQPVQIGSEEILIISMHELIYKAIQNCDVDIRPHLYSNIVLSGGSTMFPGMKERLTRISETCCYDA